MKSWCWVLIFAVGFFTLSGPVQAEDATTPVGSIQLGGAVKFVYGYSEADSGSLSPGREDFTTTLVDIRLDGMLTENVRYGMEFSSSWNRDSFTGLLAGAGNPNEFGVLGVRELFISFEGLIPMTDVKIGTFSPPISNYMPRAVEDLDLIHYPLMNNAVFENTGLFGNRPAARDSSSWQQTGINLTFQAPYMVRFDVGFWNGMMPVRLANAEQNLAKASSIVVTFEPDPAISISLAGWNEEFQQAYPGIATGAKRNLSIWYLYGSYHTGALEITADYSVGNIPDMQIALNGSFKELSWEAWQVTVGFWIVPKLELLARYEHIDPNSINDSNVPASKYDASKWATLGINYRLNDQSEVSVNYIWKNEEAWNADENSIGKDPNLAGYNPKYSGQNNDVFLIQVQAWQ